MIRKALIIRSTDALFEPRYRFARDFLISLGFEVHELTWSRTIEDSAKSDDVAGPYVFTKPAPYGAGFENLKSHFGFARFIRGVLRSLTPHVVYCCDLDTLLPVLLRKRVKVVIFDQFDPVSARFNFPKAITSFLNFLEAFSGLRADIRITANMARVPAIFRKKYLHRPNFFELERNDKLHTDWDKNSHQGNILFYGGTLGADRGLEFVASKISQLPNWKLRIFGFGPERERLMNFPTSALEINSKVSHKQLIKEASSASAILALYDPNLPNNQFTASNKLYEACQLGVPLITNRGISLGKIVEKYQLGLAIDFLDEESLVQALSRISEFTVQDRFQIQQNMEKYLKMESKSVEEVVDKIKDRLKSYVAI